MPLIETISTTQIDELSAKSQLFMMYFFNEDCPPCKDLSPRIAGLMEEYPDIPWTKIDPEDFPEMAAQRLVFTVPVIAVYMYGKELFKSSRFLDITQLRKIFDSYGDVR